MYIFLAISFATAIFIGFFLILIKPKLQRLRYLESILNKNFDGVWLYNSKQQQLIGNSYTKTIGRNAEEIIEEVVKNVLELKHDYVSQVAVANDDSTSYFSIKAWPVTLSQEELGVLVSIQDVTRGKLAELALEASEERYRQVAELSPHGVIIYGDGKIIFANAFAAKIWALSAKQELYGKRIIDLFQPPHQQIIEGILEQPVTEAVKNSMEVQILDAKGQRKDVEIAAGVYFAGERRLGQAIVRDISEQKKMEKELVKTSKLESIGVLVGGIAHDFNNLLTVIMGNISLAKMRADKESKIFINLVEAEKAATNSIDLTKQLLSFVKGDDTVREITEIGELLKESTELILCGSKVRSFYNFEPELWWVEVDKGQMRQVIHNLTINAIQAMPDGGDLLVKANNLLLLEGEQSSYSPYLTPGKYVTISITDNGVGIPDEILPKIFEPFFTSKEEGNGLGLATCYYLIKKHGGHIDVFSAQGAGTSFNIYLPAVESIDHKKAEEEMVLLKGKGKILITDDDESIRLVVMEMLSQLGYKPTGAQDGAGALMVYKEQMLAGAPFDAVIMDLTIPGGMGGIKAVGEILAVDSNAKVLLASGYADDPAILNYQEHGFKGVITKPYNIEEISQVLKEVVDPS